MNPKRLRFKQIRENAFVSIISTLATILAVTLFSSMKRADFIHFFNGVTQTDLTRLEIPAPVLECGHITDGVIAVPGAAEEGSAPKNKSYRKKVITKEIRVAEPALLVITAYAAGKYTPGPAAVSGGENQVAAHIFLDGIHCAGDLCHSNGQTGNLAAVAKTCRLLEPGKHSLKAEGLLTYTGENPFIDVTMDYFLLRTNSTHFAGGARSPRRP